MRYTPFFILISLLIFVSCNQEKQHILPQPTETIVKEDMEDFHHKSARSEWFELLHSAAPGTDWKKVEKENMMRTFQQRQEAKLHTQFRNGEVEVADGKITGKWIERGSNNQAGSVLATVFDSTNDNLYCISAGGTLWKGGIDGESWEVINQDVQFDDRFLILTQDSTGTPRLLAAIDNQIYHSEDDGYTWTPSESLPDNGGSNLRNAILMEETQELFFLYKAGQNASYKLYYSDDYGLTFKTKKNFNTSEPRNLYMTERHHSQDIFIIEQIGGERTKLHQWNNESKTLEVLVEESPAGFGSQGRANLVSTIDDDALKFILYTGDDIVKESRDTGKTWVDISVLDETPWEVGMRISKLDPDHLQIGGVECFRSYDGGHTWFLVNGWGAYYSDPATKLHADIMLMDEFTTSDGKDFVLNCNHGGMYVSYDNGLNFENIGLSGLNVSQYYSVRSSPVNPTYVFAGAQDQGFQRGEISLEDENVADLEQVISGDYGHIVFTDFGQKLWTVYPFGWITCYANPIGGGISASYTIDSADESVWIPPIIAHPDESKDIVYAAGGSIDGGSGSYIIKLEYQNGEIIEDQLPFNFRSSGGEIAAMCIDPNNHDKWFVTTTNRKYYKSEDGGETFQTFAISVPDDHYLYGAHIVASPYNEGLFYIAGSGYSNPPVLKSADGGGAWSNMSIGLPPTTVFDIAVAEDDKYIYAATEAGPYIYITEDKFWYPLGGTVAPVQTYWSVEMVPHTNIARFGTYGRGIWDFEITDEPGVSNVDEIAPEEIVLNAYPNPTTDRITLDIGPNQGNYPITVSDTQGRVVLSNANFTAGSTIDLRDLRPGAYIVSVDMNTLVKSITIYKH